MKQIFQTIKSNKQSIDCFFFCIIVKTTLTVNRQLSKQISNRVWTFSAIATIDKMNICFSSDWNILNRVHRDGKYCRQYHFAVSSVMECDFILLSLPASVDSMMLMIYLGWEKKNCINEFERIQFHFLLLSVISELQLKKTMYQLIWLRIKPFQWHNWWDMFDGFGIWNIPHW